MKAKWKKVLSFFLVIGLVLGVMPLASVKADAATEVTLSIGANKGGQDIEGRYYIEIDVEGVSIPNYGTDWTNTIALDGVEKTGVSDQSGLAYIYIDSDTIAMLLKYDFVEEGATACSDIGTHTLVLSEGQKIPFGNITLQVKEEFGIKINGEEVSSMPKDTTITTHNKDSILGIGLGGNGGWIRFAAADGLAEALPKVIEGSVTKNGVSLEKSEYRMEKPWLAVPDWSNYYHIGFEGGTTTFAVGDKLGLDILISDTSDSTRVRFDVVFECIEATNNTSTKTAVYAWKIADEQTDTPTEIPVIATVDVLNDEGRNSVGNCTNGFYFYVDTNADQTPDDDGLPYDTANWTTRYSAMSGGIYVDEELQPNIKIVKVTESLYYVPLKDNQAYDVLPTEGMLVTIHGKFGSDTQAVCYNAATFEYLGNGKWKLAGSVESEELNQEAVTIYDLYELTGVSEIQITPDAFFNLTDLKKTTNVGLKLRVPKTNYMKDSDEIAFGFSKTVANNLWTTSGYQVKINPKMGRILIVENIDNIVAQTNIEDVQKTFDLEFGVVNMINQESKLRARKVYVKVNDVEVLSWLDENLERELGTYVPAFASAGHDVKVQSVTHVGYELVYKTSVIQDLSELNGGLAYTDSKETQCVLIGEAKTSTNIALKTKIKLNKSFSRGEELKLAFSKTSTNNIWEAEESGWFVWLREGQVLIGSDMETVNTTVAYQLTDEFLLEVGTYDIEVHKDGKKIKDYGRMVYVKIDGEEVATWLDKNMGRTLGKNAIIYTSENVSARLESLTSTKYLVRKGNTVYDLFDSLGLSEVTLNKNSITKLGSMKDSTRIALKTKVTFNKKSQEFKLALSKTNPDMYWDAEASGWQFWFRPASNQIFIGYGVDSYGALIGYDFQGMKKNNFVLEIGERDVVYNTGEMYGREVYIKIDGEEVLSWVDTDYSRKLGVYATAWASENSNITFTSLTTKGYIPVEAKVDVKDIFDVSEYASVQLVANECINIGSIETMKNTAVKMNVAFNDDADEFKIGMGKVSDITLWDAEASGYQFWFRPKSNQIFIGYGVDDYAELIGYDFSILNSNSFILEIGTRNVKFQNGKQYGVRVYLKINDEEICSWVDQDSARVLGKNIIAYASANAHITISTLYKKTTLPIIYRINGNEQKSCKLVRADAVVVLGKDSRINVQVKNDPFLSTEVNGIYQNKEELECLTKQKDVYTYLVCHPKADDKIVVDIDTKKLTVDDAEIFDFYDVSGKEAITMKALQDGYIGHIIKENGPGGINTAMRCILDTPKGPYNQIRIGYLGDSSGLWSTSGFIAQITNQKASVQSSVKQTTLAEGSYELFQSGQSVVLEIGAVKCYEEGLYKYDRWYIKAGKSVKDLELVTWFDSTKRGGYGSNVMSYGTDIDGSDFTLRSLLDIKKITDVSKNAEKEKLAVYDNLDEKAYAVYYPKTVVEKSAAAIKLYTKEGMKLDTLTVANSDVKAVLTEDGGYVYEISSVEKNMDFSYVIEEDRSVYTVIGQSDGNVEVSVKNESVVAAGCTEVLVKANKGYVPATITINDNDCIERFTYDEKQGGWVYVLSGIREDKIVKATGVEKNYQVSITGAEHADVVLGGDVSDNMLPAGGTLELGVKPKRGWLIYETVVNGTQKAAKDGVLTVSPIYTDGDTLEIEVVLREGTVANTSVMGSIIPIAGIGVLVITTIGVVMFFLGKRKKGAKVSE